MSDECRRIGYLSSSNESLLTSQYPLHKACREGDVAQLARLLREGRHGVYEEDAFYGWSPAHWACYFGQSKCVYLLLEMLPVAVRSSCTTSFCQTIAHVACLGMSTGCLSLALQAGVDADAKDYLGESALHKAARSGSVECISLLVAHAADISSRNHSGQTPADLASSCGQRRCALYFEELRRVSRVEESVDTSHSPFINGFNFSAENQRRPCNSQTPTEHRALNLAAADAMEMEEAAVAESRALPLCPAAADVSSQQITAEVFGRPIGVGVLGEGRPNDGRKRCFESTNEGASKRRCSEDDLPMSCRADDATSFYNPMQTPLQLDGTCDFDLDDGLFLCLPVNQTLSTGTAFEHEQVLLREHIYADSVVFDAVIKHGS